MTVTCTINTVSASEGEARQAGGAGRGCITIAVDGTHTNAVSENSSKSTGGAFCVVGGVISEAGGVVLDALSVGVAEGGPAGEALVAGPVQAAKGNSIAVNACVKDVELEPLSAGNTDGGLRVAVVAVAGTAKPHRYQHDQHYELHFYL